MGQGSHADDVHPRLRHPPDALESDVPRCLHHGPSEPQGPDSADRLSHGLRFHVVQEDPLHSQGKDLLHLLQGPHLNFHRESVPVLPAYPLHSCSHATGRRQVVVLHQDHVVETHPVVRPSPGPHRLLLQDAPPGRRLAGVLDLGSDAAHGVYETPGQGRHTRQAAQKVQSRPLPGQDPPQGSLQTQDHASGLHCLAVPDQDACGDVRIHPLEDFHRHVHSSHHNLSLGHDFRRPPGAWIHRPQGGPIPRSHVLRQGSADEDLHDLLPARACLARRLGLPGPGRLRGPGILLPSLRRQHRLTSPGKGREGIVLPPPNSRVQTGGRPAAPGVARTCGWPGRRSPPPPRFPP